MSDQRYIGVMLKILTAAIVALTLSVTTALAADTAERRILGFSPDGKWFAFEQFGSQDGSGFPYHDVFVIDLINDKWAPQTPVRIQINDEMATAHQAWQKARVKAAPVLAKLKIVKRGLRLASNPRTEISPTPNKVSFHLHPNLTGQQDRYTLALETFTVPKPADCQYADGPIQGFALKLAVGNDPPSEVYRDKSVPKSRHCALDYRIADVLIDEENLRPERLVVLLYVFSRGFEGSDARFIALPITIP